MSLSTYATFQTAIADQLARSDLTTQIVDCITLFEAEASYELFRTRGTETTTTLTPASDGTVALPTDYLGWRRVTWSGTPKANLIYVHPSEWALQVPADITQTGTPRIFTIEGSTLKISPLDTTTLAFDYFAKTAALSGSLNWLFTNRVDAYWDGVLEQIYRYMKDDDRADYYQSKKVAVYDQIKKQRFREDGGLYIRVDRSSYGATP